MADFEEMKKAVARALEHVSNEYLNFCNSCKSDYDSFSGSHVQIPTSSDLYSIWYCDDCLTRELEYI